MPRRAATASPIRPAPPPSPKSSTRWQDYAEHLGGIVGYAADASSLQFDGGFYSPNHRKRGAWGDHWTFKVDRLTG